MKEKRLERLRKSLQTLPCDALLIEDPIDLFYLTGMKLSKGELIVTEKEARLIVDGRYLEICQQQPLYPVQLLQENSLQETLADFQVKVLGFDERHMSYKAWVSLMESITKVCAVPLVPTDSVVQKLRMIKDEEEIEALRRAARLGYEGYEYVVSLLQEGISESTLALELEFFWKKKGGSALAFDPIIAFSSNSSMPHYRAGETKLCKGTSVLIDIGVILNNYHSDMTRVVPFGTPPPIFKEIYLIVQEAKEKAFALCHPGSTVGELDRAARSWITSKGYGEYFTHSLGHGVGLEIHEPPFIRETGPYGAFPLEPGMVITIEPGIYLPGIGGVRLEDTIVITKNGFENLTNDRE